jgi:hypothetical protein
MEPWRGTVKGQKEKCKKPPYLLKKREGSCSPVNHYFKRSYIEF